LSLEENKAIVRRLYEAVNTKDLSSIEDFIALDYIGHSRNIQGLEKFKQFGRTIFKAFPDFHETTKDIIAEGDKVWVYSTITATNTGEYLGLAPNGKKFTEESVDIFHIVDGKIVEGWNIQNELDFLKKLGFIEYTEKGKKLFPKED
jgi:predicted ester cyclase